MKQKIKETSINFEMLEPLLDGKNKKRVFIKINMLCYYGEVLKGSFCDCIFMIITFIKFHPIPFPGFLAYSVLVADGIDQIQHGFKFFSVRAPSSESCSTIFMVFTLQR